MVLIVSTPFVRATEEHHRVEGTVAGTFLPEIHFCRSDLVSEFRGVPFRLEENIPTDSPFGREHIFYLSKEGPACHQTIPRYRLPTGGLVRQSATSTSTSRSSTAMQVVART